MSVNALIAQGVAPIGRDLPDIMNMNRENQRRNRLLDLETRQTEFRERAYGDQQAAAQAQQQQASQRQQIEQTLAAARWVRERRVPKAVLQAQMPGVAEAYESLRGPGSWASATDDDVFATAGEVEAMAASQLGMGPPEEKQGPAQATSIQEYEAAKATGFGGSYLDFQRAKAQAGQVVTPSYSTVQLEDGSYGIFDSRTGQIKPTDQKAPPKGKPDPGVSPAAMQARVSDAQNVTDAISDAENLTGFFTTGLVGQVIGNLGGTPAYDLRRAVDTVKANIGFDRLQRMREESKTGGALGQVAVQELTMLQATIASLDANQSETRLRTSLSRVKKQYERAMAAYERAMQQQAAGGAPAGDANVVDWNSL